ncbi:YceI family protein [Ornithinibacillus contaminans]|uniref:YceI family protein n=1 Tax=Ornithinibacillus contaminans TaxID=694055 RepID=UPI00064DB4C7|nr:YceI family protein [Ornithinibacillus contaminans]
MAKAVWAIDKGHSSLEFSVKHMMMSKVKGVFNDFEATVEADVNDLTDAKIEFTVDLNSIDTRKEDRDNHLRSGDFFDVENYPTMTFVATTINKTADNLYDVTGDLTIRGVTKPVTFEITVEGVHKDPWGNEVAGFTGEGKLNRKDFGLVWNAALETGGVLVGEDVTINIELEAHKQA